MGGFDDFLSLPSAGSPLPGSSPLSPVRPTVAGLQWVDVPWGKSSGLVYRINDSNIVESLIVPGSGGSPTGATVVNSLVLPAGAVRIASSPDGRMVAVACCDGSLHCIDSTASAMSLRWSISDAHSHVVPDGGDVGSPVSADRSNAACASGPVLSLDFSAENYMLILVDANKGFAMYDARIASPSNIITPQQSAAVALVSNATWCKHDDIEKGNYLAIGRFDGSTAVLKFDVDSMFLQAITELGCPSDEEGFVCTHLNWSAQTLAVGLCRVIPPVDGEEPDEEDEDDNADHEAVMYLATMDEDFALGKATEWMEQGDVVPFFSVPKYGRHVFFTSFLRSSSQNLLAVTVNVGTDVGIIAKDSSGGEWTAVEFQEGNAASLPTNEDDEFTFPLGVAVVQTPSSSFRMLLASTDGSLSSFLFKHTNDPDCFAAPLLGDAASLPSDAVPTAQPSMELKKQPSKSSDDGSSWVVVDESGKKSNETDGKPENAPFSSASVQPSHPAGSSSGFSFGATGSSSFGQGSGTPAFGSVPVAPVFGSGSSAPSFNFSSAAPTFGAPSTLGSGTSAPKQSGTPQATTPFASTGFGATGGFGFGSSPSPGGFAAIAASNKSGFGASPSMAPFNAFSKPLAGESPASTFGAKPLFGSSSSPVKTSIVPAFGTQSPQDEKLSSTSAKSDEVCLVGESPVTGSETPLGSTADKPSTDQAEEVSGPESTAIEVFDQFDTKKTGTIPVSSFEDMLEAVGEGFYGDEYDAQLALIDPAKSGQISKKAFVEWYKTLVTSSGDDDGSLDTEAQEERAEEEASAKEAFAKLSRTANGKHFIDATQFGDLIESLGTTYCEEQHQRTVERLEKDDHHIYEDDFLAWYIGWLFGGDEDSNVEQPGMDGNQDNDLNDNQGTASEKKESLRDLFKVEDDSWKCEVCTVRNKGGVNKCSACETPRPGFEKAEAASPADAPGTDGGSSIGPGGFSFGGGAAATSGSIGSSGFSFGGGAPAAGPSAGDGFSFGSHSPIPAPAPAPSTGGFSFGSSTFGGDDKKSTQGFSFGNPHPKAPEKESSAASASLTPPPVATRTKGCTQPEPEKNTKQSPPQPDLNGTDSKEELSGPESTAIEVFDQFDTKKTGTIPVSSFEDMLEAVGEGFYGDEYDAQLALIDPAKSGQISKKAFVEWYKTLVTSSGDDDGSLDTEAQEERAEEEASAKEAFAKLSRTANGKHFIDATQFGDLIESLGTTYCEEQHQRTVERLEKDDHHIYEDDFLAWYIGWLFGGDEDSNVEQPGMDGNQDNDLNDNQGTASEKKESLRDLFKVEDDSWKCEVCTVRNKGGVNKCSACETPRPGFEKAEAASPADAPGTDGGSSIGPGGFSFGGGAAAASGSIGSSGFSFGGGAPAAGPSAGGGFSFGSRSPIPAPAPSTGGFSFGSSTFGGDDKKSTQGFSFGSPQVLTSKEDPEPATAAFPLSSTKAPTPFSSMGPKTPSAPKSSAPAASAFPPSSTKAPTPFSSMGAKKSSAPAASAFPPSSTKAPTPFSSKSSTPAASAFPPSSTKAPTPFSSMGAKKSSAPAASAFPPSSTKAPTPFSSKSSAPAASAFPPSSTKAPTPFSSKSSAPAASAFPPSSTKAPTPFSSKSSTPAASAFPPSSTKAPTPFSSMGAKKSSAPAASAFPPSSTKAPTPFSSKGSAPPASAFPPSSTKAPTPFSSMGAKGSMASSAFPPSSAKAPKPITSLNEPSLSSSSEKKSPPSVRLPAFGMKQEGAAPTTTSFGLQKGATSFEAKDTLNAQAAPSARNTERMYGREVTEARSELQLQFDGLCTGFERTLSELSRMNAIAAADSQGLRDQIERSVTMTQEERAKLLGIDDFLKKRTEDAAFLLSRKTDLSRHIEDAQKLIEIVQKADSESNVIDTQPLDMESEMHRRKFAAMVWRIHHQLQLAEERLNFLKSLGNNEDNGHLKLLQQVSDLYEQAQAFESNRIQPIFDRISSTSKNVPRWQERSTGRSTYCLDDPPLKQRSGSRCIPSENRLVISRRDTDSSKTTLTRWRATERSIATTNFQTNKFKQFSDSSQSAVGKSRRATPSRRSEAPSLLLSPAPSRAPPRSSAESVDIFSPPSEVKIRSGWDEPSTLERKKMDQALSINAPKELKQTTLLEASRLMLSSIGSTPEKLKAVTDMKRSDVGSASASSTIDNHKSPPPKATRSAATSQQSSSQLPPRVERASHAPKTNDRPSAFPQPSNAAPQLFPVQPSSAKSDSNTRSDLPSEMAKFGPNSAGFGDMKGLGDSLFEAGKSTTKVVDETKTTTSSSGISTAELSAGPPNQTKDYKAILTSILQKSNPSKLGAIDGFLQKHKGNEEVQIAKIAKKYNFPNPFGGDKQGLEQKPPAASAPVSAFGVSGATTPASSPSPFTSGAATSSPFGIAGLSNTSSGQNNGVSLSSVPSAGVSQTQAPFGSASAPASSPFAASPASAPANSPFVTSPASAPSAMAPSPSPFASAPANSSPFGSQSGGLSSTTPFGTQVSSPFGSTTPAQSGGPKLFNGKPARDLLMQFYREMNPSKLAKVDDVLQKYKGREDEMFRKIANQYNVDPSKFGLSGNTAPIGFGSPAAAPAFGQSSTIGGGPSPFSQGGGGFGQPSALGSSVSSSAAVGTSPGGHTFGSVSNTGFGAATFGSLAQSPPSTFGSPAPGFGGGGFGSPAPAYGTPFGAARR